MWFFSDLDTVIKTMQKLLHDAQARNVKLKEERMLLWQALSKAQRSESANLHGSDEVQNMELQVPKKH